MSMVTFLCERTGARAIPCRIAFVTSILLMAQNVGFTDTDAPVESQSPTAVESDKDQRVRSIDPNGTAVDTTSRWLHDMNVARQRAKAERKVILMNFTGSDWCGWCMRLSNEVFSQPEFQQWADQKLILVELDFPNDASKLDEPTKQHNEDWLKKLRVSGFPTIFLVDESGRPFAKTGYQEGGPEEYVQHLQQLLQIRLLRDTAFRLADDADGQDRLRYLDDALSTLEPQIAALHYGDTIDELIESGDDNIKAKYQRLRSIAEGGPEAAGMIREEWMADPLGFLAADMQETSKCLDQVKTKPPVETYHPRIEYRLTKLIELMNKT